jgi:triacylglycerol lipase
MAQHTIILAHGILGYGAIPGVSSFLNYFNGVAAHLTRQGHTVIAPQVNPVGSVAQRGKQLAAAILEVPLSGDERLHVIAHSMGGLDARFALHNVTYVAERVKTLVTIGTPHRGSPVADAVLNHADPLFVYVPKFLVDLFEANTGGLRDLTTAIGGQFDDATPDSDGVRYIEVTGDASRENRTLLLFKIASEIGRIRGEVNDGVVTRSSALRPGREHLDDWPVDHFGETGWGLDPASLFSFARPLFAPPEHLARYDAIVSML